MTDKNIDKIEIKYLDLVKKTVVADFYPFTYLDIDYPTSNFIKRIIKKIIIKTISKNKISIKKTLTPDEVENGSERSSLSFSMVGKKRLNNVHKLIDRIFKDNIEGDFLEAGIWKGGIIIFMRACLLAYNDKNRKVWGIDSFKGLPPLDVHNFPEDKIFEKILDDWNRQEMIVSKKEVIENINKFDLYDNQVELIEGWFSDVFKKNYNIKKLSLCRIDGDLYQSTYEALVGLYPKISLGGYVIIDDYGLWSGACKKAVDRFREENNINSELIKIDWAGVYWRKEK